MLIQCVLVPHKENEISSNTTTSNRDIFVTMPMRLKVICHFHKLTHSVHGVITGMNNLIISLEMMFITKICTQNYKLLLSLRLAFSMYSDIVVFIAPLTCFKS